jgi:hypothetical protein
MSRSLTPRPVTLPNGLLRVINLIRNTQAEVSVLRPGWLMVAFLISNTIHSVVAKTPNWKIRKLQEEFSLLGCNAIDVSEEQSASSGSLFLLSVYCWFLTSLTLRPWKWRWYVPPKHRRTSTELHGVTIQKVVYLKSPLWEPLIQHGKSQFTQVIKSLWMRIRIALRNSTTVLAHRVNSRGYSAY